jgi:hypothetical protein
MKATAIKSDRKEEKKVTEIKVTDCTTKRYGSKRDSNGKDK